DQVAGARDGTADGIGGRSFVIDSLKGVAEPHGAGNVGADPIAQDLVARGGVPDQVDAGVAVGGEEVARARGGAADEVARRARDPDPGPPVAQPTGPADGGANKIALHQVAQLSGAVLKEAV